MRGKPAAIRLFNSLQTRMVVILLLIILLPMELVGTYLSRSLEKYYVEQYRADLQQLAETVVYVSAPILAGTASAAGIGPSGEGRQGELDLWVDRFVRPGVQLTITDASGAVVSSSEDALLGKSLGAELEVRQALEGDPAESTRLEAGERVIYMATPVVVERRVVGAVRLRGSLFKVDEMLRGMRAILSTATVLVLSVSALLSFFLASTIIGPIKELTRHADALAGGDFQRLIPVRSEDEIGRLAKSFNHLTVRLKETLEEISAERRKAEAILSNMADGLLALDGEGRIIHVNPAAARMLETEAGALEGRRLAEVLPGMALEDSGPFAHRGLVLRARVAPLRAGGGHVTGTVVVLHDVTEQERLERMRREFVANVSHELRTPLTTIKSYVETLLDGALEDPEVAERFLGVVNREAERMTRLVSDLLTLSHLDSGSLHLDQQPTSLAELVADVCEKFLERCQRKEIVLRGTYEPGLPLVMADRDRMEQVLSNLLNNAVDFTPSGGRIEVRVEAAEQGVVVRVTDTGAGIPHEDLPRIFERFYRVDKARSREFGGTGLGLSIAKEIVESHGGRIGIESTLGRGTEVWFWLPTLTEGANEDGHGRERAAGSA